MTPSIRHLLAKAPLRWILIVPFVFQLSLAAGLIGWLSILNGQKAVNEIASQLWQETTTRVNTEMDDLLSTTRIVNDLSVKTIQRENLDLTNIRSVEDVYWDYINTFQKILGVGIGNTSGDILAMFQRIQNGKTLYFLEYSNPETQGKYINIQLDRQREVVQSNIFDRQIDARERPWYKAAVEAGQPVWTDVYTSVSQVEGHTLAINASQPIYGSDRQLQGVASVILDLGQVSQLLEEIELSPAGQIYIVEANGDLIGSSDGKNPVLVTEDEVSRLRATESQNPLIQKSAAYMDTVFEGELQSIQDSMPLAFDLEGDRQYLQITPLGSSNQLQWFIVVVVPESDFMAQIYAINRNTILLCILSLMLAIGSGIVTAHWLTRPILQLNRAAKEIADGNLQQQTYRKTIATDRSREIGELVTSFSQMTRQLQTSFTALQASEADFRNVATGVPGAIIRYVLRPDGSDAVSYMSPGCAELWEIEKEVVEQDASVLWQVVHPEDLPAMQGSVAESARTLETWYHEWRIHTPSGRVKWLEGRGNPTRQPNGDIVWGTVILDVSDRKHAEIMLQDLSNRLDLAVRSANIGVWDWDIVNDHLVWDDRMCELYGITHSEFENSYKDWETRLHPADVQKCSDSVQQALAGNQDYAVEFRVAFPDGTNRYINAYGLIQRNAEGQPTRMIGVNLDVTERKQAEADRLQKEKLRLELALLETVLDSVLAGYWDWDIPNHREYMSPGLKRMLGYEEDELPNVPETRQRLIFEDDLPGVIECFDRHVHSQGKEPFYNEVRYHHKNGDTVWVICAGEVIDWDSSGHPLRMAGCHVDITQLKQTEKQLLQTASQLKSSNQELEAFAYSVSHDLRSPLRAIDGFSKALLEDYGDQFDPDGQYYFDRIRQNVKRMGGLIDDLLNLSRISRAEMRYQPINLSELVWTHANELQSSDPDRQVEFVIASNVVVNGDRTLMNAVISNLIGNAWKFTSHHATARIEFGTTQQDRQAVYFVRDDGAGFNMSYVAKLFEVFQRLHSPTEFSGTGIGLAIVQRAILRHGGKVWAEGEVEKGATIYFTLPAML